MIYFGSYFNKNQHIGKVLSISVTQPGNYEEFYELFPSIKLLYQYKDGNLKWQEYKKLYREILENRKENIIDILSNREEENLTFCCWEKYPYRCHRIIAFEFLKDIGYNVVLG